METELTALRAKFATATPIPQAHAQETAARTRCPVAANQDTMGTDYDARCAGRVLRTPPCLHTALGEALQTMSPAGVMRVSLATASIAQCAGLVTSMLKRQLCVGLEVVQTALIAPAQPAIVDLALYARSALQGLTLHKVHVKELNVLSFL